jgi:NADPH:quinone reductase-like Zn-dependent oxidoreductase
MRAIVWTAYGSPDGLQLREVETPTPKDDEVRIKIHATTVTAGDCEMRTLKLPLMLGLPMRLAVGLRRPTRKTILGMELAGEIESLGDNVKLFKEGDQVFGIPTFSEGTYAEYVCLAEKPDEGVLATKPANLSYEEAAAVPVGGLEALHHLRQASVQSGQKVLVNGAGGTIGTMAVQLAKYFGAEVTAVDTTAKFEMLRSIGADKVIDFTQEDFTQRGETYDVIFDVVGKASYPGSMRSLVEEGVYVSANPRLSQMLRGQWTTRTSSKKVVVATSSHKTEDLVFLKELIEAGKIKPVIDRTFPLEQVPEAHRYVERGGKKGNVVIAVADGNDG